MLKKPHWVKISLPKISSKYREVISILKKYNLNTVCKEAKCPNTGECWGQGEATFMILGNICTRNCKFCATQTGNPEQYVDREEPERIKNAVVELGLNYVVLTSVDRDDLEDYGSEVFFETAKKLKEIGVNIEVLTPDFGGDENLIKKVIEGGVDVFAHNVEVVKRFTPILRDRKASYKLSLSVLEKVKSISDVFIKSGFMVGIGETKEEVYKTLNDLYNSGVDIVTIGQYLQPAKDKHKVIRYVSPNEFIEYKIYGESIGIKHVESGPLVRSSYNAKKIYEKLISNKSITI